MPNGRAIAILLQGNHAPQLRARPPSHQLVKIFDHQNQPDGAPARIAVDGKLVPDRRKRFTQQDQLPAFRYR